MQNVRRSGAWLVAGVSLCMLGFLLVTGSRLRRKLKRRNGSQYKIVQVLPDTQNMQTALNEFGAGGWELVAVSMGDMTEPRMIFKK